MAKSIRINNRYVGDGHPCYIIAEMSANHAGDIKIAKDIINAAKVAGADCIKIQTYTPDTLTINSKKTYFHINKGTWSGENLYQLYQKAYTPWEWHQELKDEADRIEIDFFSTPYERSSVDFLEEIGVEFYKVASFELTYLPFLEYLASKGKPIILSTGMAMLGEIEEAVKAIHKQGNEQIILLKCSSSYPAVPEDMNLKAIPHLAETFSVPAGLSDHSLGSVSAIAAVALGANVIEKHFCLSREIVTPDSSFSMEPEEFEIMVRDIRIAERAVGKISYQLSPSEVKSRIFRRSIFTIKDIKAGEELTEKNIRVIRPGYGLKPKYYSEVIGKKAVVDLKRGNPLEWGMFY